MAISYQIGESRLWVVWVDENNNSIIDALLKAAFDALIAVSFILCIECIMLRVV